jgi:sec-independent protein translocase protein TatA
MRRLIEEAPMLGMIGPETLIIVLVMALIVFGPKKLPEMGKTIGKGLQEFRKVQEDVRREIRQGVNETPPGESPSSASSPSATEAPATGTSATDGQDISEHPS